MEEVVSPCICFYVHPLAARFDAAYFFQQVDMPVWPLNSLQLVRGAIRKRLLGIKGESRFCEEQRCCKQPKGKYGSLRSVLHDIVQYRREEVEE